jgi:Ca2+-binding RTX toxin-like protein
MSMVVSVSTGLGQGSGLEGLGQLLSPELLGQIQRSQGAGAAIEAPSPLDVARQGMQRSQFPMDATGGQAGMFPFFPPEKPSPIEEDYSERANEDLWQFGYEVFTTIAPPQELVTGAIGDGYRLGIGDEIVATFIGQTERTVRTRVDREGRVILSEMPPLSAAGRSFGDFRRDLEAQTRASFLGTEVFVSIGALRSVSIMVSGEVKHPGVYNLTGLSTLFDALVYAGGIEKTGSLRQVKVIRGDSIFWLDIYDLLFTGFVDRDVTIADGDRIVVPTLGPTVAIAGNDRLYGEHGDDWLFGGSGDDTMWGANGLDRLYGGDGSDGLYAGNDDDLLDGGAGNDDLDGGAGNDIYLYSFGDGSDRISDTGGSDSLVFRGAGTVVGIETLGDDLRILLGGGSQLDIVDHLAGGAVEQLSFQDSPDIVQNLGPGAGGTMGGDWLVGTVGDDRFGGWNGSDWLLGGPGNDGLYGEHGDDWLRGGEGNDGLWGANGRDRLNGGGGGDALYGGNDGDTLDGGAGDDALYGGAGDDILVYDAADQTIVNGGSGTDTLRLDGAGVALDLAPLAGISHHGIEQIDLTGTGDNALTLNAADVLAFSDETNTLTVFGNAGDSVSTSDGGWAGGGLVDIGGVFFESYTQGLATLLVDQAIDQSGILF